MARVRLLASWLIGLGLGLPAAERAIQAQSLQGRAGHIALEAFGRDSSLTHVELMPFVEGQGGLLFGDARFFSTNEGHVGGNFGVGYRLHAPGWDRFFGTSFWYDIDDTTGELFHQVGVSLETCGPVWDVRSNLYLPVGDDRQDYGTTLGNPRFAGNDIRYDVFREYGEAMKGADFEYGLLLPFEATRAHNVRAYAGAYYFAGDTLPDIVGWKTRVEGYLTDHVALEAELTDDGTFGTNVTLGVSILLPGGPRGASSGCSPLNRPFPYVQRNYNIIVPRDTDVQTGMTAVNPETGQPYVVRHVSSSATGGSVGATAESPFADIGEAQSVASDIIFVHAGTVLTDSLVLQPGQRVLGEGTSHYVNVAEFGSMLLPGATGGVDRPVIRGTAGDAVTLASDSELSGFVIEDAGGYGVVGRGVQNVLVSALDVRNSGLSGIFLQDVSGDATLRNVAVRNSAAAGIEVQGGNGAVAFEGENVVENAGGAGVLVHGAAGDVSFESLSVQASGAAPGVRVADGAGSVSFERLDITSNGGTGLEARNSGKLTVSSGTIASTGGSAADIENTQMDVALTSVSSSGATYGLRIVDSGGKFLVFGTGAKGTGGMIQNATTGVLVVDSGTVGFQYLDLDGNTTAADVSAANYFVLAGARVTDSVDYGVHSVNTKVFELVDSTFENNGAAGRNTVLVLNDAGGSYTSVIHSNTFTDASDAAIAIRSSGAGDGSTLLSVIAGNAFTSQRAGAAAIAMDYNGTVEASFDDNVFAATGGSNVGIDISGRSTSALLKVAAAENTFAFEGGDDVGLRFHTLGPAAIALTDNIIDFSAARGIGMDFTLASQANVVLAGNSITDEVSEGTGILFRSIAGPSSVTMNGNTIDLQGPVHLLDRGIIFESATGTTTLSSNLNNVVKGPRRCSMRRWERRAAISGSTAQRGRKPPSELAVRIRENN